MEQPKIEPEVLDDTIGTLECWLGGYTDPSEDGEQFYVVLLGTEGGTLHVAYGRNYYEARDPEARREYRITVTVEEVS